MKCLENTFSQNKYINLQGVLQRIEVLVKMFMSLFNDFDSSGLTETIM